MQNGDIQRAYEQKVADSVAQSIVNHFNCLKIKSGKPTTRSNGVKEWTVLSGLACILPKEDSNFEVYPISIATGVKALPNKIRSYSNGLIVHDSHAEILSIRIFNWFLLNECNKLNAGNYHSKVIEPLDDHFEKYKLKDGVKLALFITEPPCGDVSMSYLSESLEDNFPWEGNPTKRSKLNSTENVTRGRSYFNKLGVVRTKPGRSDSLITLSKSCSDKLCLRQLIGLTNSFTDFLFPEGIFLDYLILKNGKFNINDANRCFQERFVKKLDVDVHSLKIITYDEDEYKYHKPTNDSTMVPCQLSLLYLVPTKTVEVIDNGVKNGCFIKNKPPKRRGECFICNQQLYNKFKTLFPNGFATYKDLKFSNKQRQVLKQKGRGILGNWIPTDIDDFTLN